MSPPFRHHIFICENRRPDGHPKGSCAAKGSEEVRSRLKTALAKAGVRDVRANSAGCLDICEEGPTVVVYPEGVWYCGVKPEDADAIVREHIQGGQPVERLLSPKAHRK